MIHGRRYVAFLLFFMLLTFVCMSCGHRKPVNKKCGPGYVWVPGHTSNHGVWLPGRCVRK